METNHIIDRIQKLLNLQKGAESIGSLEEAQNAAAKVQALLMKHNLEIADIESHSGKKKSSIEKDSLRDIITKKNESDWIIKLYSTVAHYNFGQVVTTTTHDIKGNRRQYVNLVGTRENIDAIKFLCEQLEYKIRNLENDSWKVNGSFSKRNSYRRAYFDGAVSGLNEKLYKQQQYEMSANNSCTAIVLDHRKRIKEELPNLFESLRYNNKPEKIKSDLIARSNGYNDGKNININKGVNGNNSQMSLD